MKSPFRILFAAALLLAGLVPARALVVGTFNLRNDNERDAQNGNGWSQRAPVIASLIRFNRFDVLGTQEGLQNQVKDLQVLLPAYAVSGCGRDDGKEAGEYAAIFFRKDTFTLKAEGTFWLSETPKTPSIGWDAKLKRICSWVKLEAKATHQTFFVFNTHFDHQGTVARSESARLIIKSIQEIAGDQPALLEGDFNVDQTSESYKVLHDSGVLSDSYETTPERYALDGTTNGFNVNSHTDSRIDHIFHTRGFKPLRYGVLTDTYRKPLAEKPEAGSDTSASEVKPKKYQARTLSDHFPILVEFE